MTAQVSAPILPAAVPASGPSPRPGVLSIEPYVGGESKAAVHPVLGRTIRLASNEGALGPSPKAMAAYTALAGDLHRYPDGGCTALRRAVGDLYGLDPERVVFGAGSDELIALLVKAYAGPGDTVVHTERGFLMYRLSALAAGAEPVAAPEADDLQADVDALLARVDHRTRIVFLANPNNPTGRYLPPEEVARLHAALPDGCILALDAAYAEYVTVPDYDSGASLVEAADNVVMFRTFSKIHGLAALRLGWVYGPEGIVDVLNRVRGPFNVSAAAQAAGVAALDDTAFAARSRDENTRMRDWTEAQLTALGLHVVPSVTNFLLVDFAPRGVQAEAVRQHLKGRGILVRQMGGYGLPGHLRIGIGTEDEMRAVMADLTAFLGA